MYIIFGESMTKTIMKTIYITEDLAEQIEANGNGSFSARIIDLICKGLAYEKGIKELTLEQALGYFTNLYRKKYPNKPIP